MSTANIQPPWDTTRFKTYDLVEHDKFIGRDLSSPDRPVERISLTVRSKTSPGLFDQPPPPGSGGD